MEYFSHQLFGKREAYTKEIRKASLERLAHLVRVCARAIVIISIIIVAVQMNGGKPADLTLPTYSDVRTSSTTQGSSCTFSVLWADDANVSGYIFETTTGNFKNLVRTRVYDETIFHRVVPGFVIQGGDATSKGITVPAIPDKLPNKHSNVRGSVAMAKTSDPNSASSQFFINLKDANAASLDSNYSVFGTVIEGMDVVDAISRVPISPPDDGQPLQDVTLIVAQLIR